MTAGGLFCLTQIFKRSWAAQCRFHGQTCIQILHVHYKRNARAAGQDCSARLWQLPPEATGNAAEDAAPAAAKRKNSGRKPVSAVQPRLVAVYRCHLKLFCVGVAIGHSTPSKLGRSPRSSSSCVPYLPMQLGLLVNVAVRRGHADSLASVGVNPNGSRFVSGGWDGAIHVWRTGAQSCCRVIVAWSPADALLIIALAVTCRQTARGSGLSRSQAVAPSKRLSEEERSERPVYLAWQGGQSWTRQRRRKRRARQTTPLAAARGVLRAAALQMALPVMAAA